MSSSLLLHVFPLVELVRGAAGRLLGSAEILKYGLDESLSVGPRAIDD